MTLRPEGGGAGLSFQLEEDHVPPVWPAGPGDPRMQLHLDVEVDDLDAALEVAVAAGATWPSSSRRTTSGSSSTRPATRSASG